MYVCICNALKEKEIREKAVECPDATAEEIYASLGVDPDCGTCLYYAQDMIDEERTKLAAPVKMVSL
ncbi:MAG: ferredoxin [Alphaproteobacteria bacterium]|nr:ferredoxin [Alphaproteobacteria bacterium]